MKKIILNITLCFIAEVVFGQVGINTNTPQELLHIAGNSDNVRVEGLNVENNEDNLGVGSTSKVFVDANGDLIIGRGLEDDRIAILVDSEDYLNDSGPGRLVVQTGVNFGYTPAGVVTDIPNAEFTLNANAILEVNYSVSWDIFQTVEGEKKRITDSRARVIQTGIYFIDTDSEDEIIYDVNGDPINGGPWCINANGQPSNCNNWAGLIGLTAQFYNNADKELGAYKDFRNTASDYVRLGPGNYMALFAVLVKVEVTNGVGAAKLYVGTAKDELQIIAHYYD